LSNFSLGLSLFGAMLTLMILRVPISVAMFLPGAVGYWLLAGDASLLNYLKGATYARFSNYDLSVIPLFILMGQFATQGGLSRALFKFASSLLGHLRGHARRRRHPRHPDSAIGAAGRVCDPDRNEYRQALHGGLHPRHHRGGRLLHRDRHHRDAAPRTRTGAATRPERLRAFLEIWPIAAVFVIVCGGIYGGYFTPTEGAAVGAAGTFVAALLRRELSLKGIGRSFLGTAMTSGMIFMVFLGGDHGPRPVGARVHRKGDLVRDPDADGGRDRAGASARGAEHFRDQQSRQGRADDGNLQRRHSVPALGFPARDPAVRVPDREPVSGTADILIRHEGQGFHTAGLQRT
jgi:hypothetical protein